MIVKNLEERKSLMNKSRGATFDLTSGNVTSTLLKFSMPFLVSSILQTLYSTVDAIIVGQFMGSYGLSAVNNASYIVNAMSCLGMGASVGASVFISQYAGAKRYDELSKIMGTSLTLSFFLAAILAVVVILISNPFLTLINLEAQTHTEARNYLVVRALGLLISFTYNTLTSVMRGLGDSKRPMIFVAVASIANVFLDLLFVAVFKWGAGGAAIATEISQLITLLCAVFYLRRKKDYIPGFTKKSLKIDWPTAKVVMKVGVPASVQYVFIDLSFVFVNSMVNSFGEIASAAIAVGSKIVNLGEVGISALSTGVATMAAQNIGAGQQDRAARTVKVAVRISVVMMTIIYILIQIFPEQLVRLFNSDEAALSESVRCLRILPLMYFSASFFFIYVCMATAVGNTGFALLCYILDGVVVRISMSLLLTRVFGMGLEGIYWAMGLAPSLSAIISAVYFYSGRWRSRNLLES